MGRVILVAGWAHRKGDLDGLASAVSRSREAVVASCADLLSMAERAGASGGPPLISPYARALASLAGGVDGPCAVVGWSMGGIVALEAVSSGALRVDRMVLIGATARYCAADGYPHGVPAAHLRALRIGLRKNPRRTLRAFFHDVASPEVPAEGKINERVEAAMALGASALAHGLGYLQETELRDRLPKIGVPALVIHGRRDRIVPWRAGDYLARHLAGGRLVVHDDAGHGVASGRPGLLGPGIGEFLNYSGKQDFS